jgi:hypothetical protein
MTLKLLKPFSIFSQPEKLAIILVNGRKNPLPLKYKMLWNSSLTRACTDGAAEMLRQDCW